MRSYSALLLLLLTANISHAASPVLPLEMISRNAQGQQVINALIGLSGMSARGNKVAFTMSDRAFFNEPPAPPPMPPGSSDIPQYGQIALWQRGRAPVPLMDFRDGFGPTNFLSSYSNAFHVKLHEDSNRVCLTSRGDLVRGIREQSFFGVACSDQPGPPYYYLPGVDGAGLANTIGTYGGARFDLYGGDGILLHDRQTGSVESVSLANDGHRAADSDVGNVSDDGRWVVFKSNDNTLVVGDTGSSVGGFPNGGRDIFIRDHLLSTTRRLLRPDGSELLGHLNSYYDFSANGRFLVFSSTGDVVEPCLTNFNGPPSQGLSPEPIFVHDFQTNSTECISLTQSGQAFGNGFQSGVDNRVSISGDGRFVAYVTRFAADPNDTNYKDDIYLRDRKLNRTIWVSQAANGAPGNSRAESPLLSEDGRWLAFVSYASNLVPNDTNLPAFGNPNFQGGDIFLRDLSALSVEPVQVPAGSNSGWALLVLGLLGFGMRVEFGGLRFDA